MIPLSLRASSAINGLGFPVIVPQTSQVLHSLILQLDQTQWLPSTDLKALQNQQLALLLSHVWANVPWYHQRLRDAGLTPGKSLNASNWNALKTLSRSEIQQAGTTLHSLSYPPEHGNTQETTTSGSTGEPLKVLRTGLDALMWQAMTLRDHSWHQRDTSGSLCIVRAGVQPTPDGRWLNGWGPATNALVEGGRSALFPINQDVAAIADWLAKRNPDYLLIYPTVLAALLRLLQEKPINLTNLRQVRTISEVLTRETRDLCQRVLGVPVIDLYSTVEVGNIALQCPDSDNYHLMAEDVLVEILDHEGRECGPGQTGRVVVTSLHSFAAPLLRYELTDHAEVAQPCPCGRGLPTIKQIHGRTRNMLMRPDGEMFWPAHGKTDYRAVAPVRQFQIVQLAADHLEFRLVVERPLLPTEEVALTNTLMQAIGNFSRIDLRYFSALPHGKNGKFEEFISMVANDSSNPSSRPSAN